MSAIRSRWAALGAAIAISLGAGGIGFVSATSPSSAATFVPIVACRVLDTRPSFQVGPRSTPLGVEETITVLATGDTGECTAVPATATGVVLNVTATDASQATYLTIWETGQGRPNASSLNPVPGQPPTPNAVTTGIDGDGNFDIYNLDGQVDVIVDIVGYYTDHHHDDRYYTKQQTDGLVNPLIASGPLEMDLGAERVGAFVNSSNEITEWYYRGGQAWAGQPNPPTGEGMAGKSRMNSHRIRDRNAPVALLLSSTTASSGEAVAVAFLGRPNLRSTHKDSTWRR